MPDESNADLVTDRSRAAKKIRLGCRHVVRPNWGDTLGRLWAPLRCIGVAWIVLLDFGRFAQCVVKG